jgi:hypothetical protein
MTWILALMTVLLLWSMAVACYREARQARPFPHSAADRLLAEAGIRRVTFRPAPRPGACAR